MIDELDSLTGLYPATFLLPDVGRHLAPASKLSGRLALVELNLDGFRAVNKTYGYGTGDDVLVGVAHALLYKRSDRERAYRSYGDNFFLLLRDYVLADAVATAERVRQQITAGCITRDHIDVTASLGVACFPDHAENAGRLCWCVDAALREAKLSGGNCVRVFQQKTGSSLGPSGGAFALVRRRPPRKGPLRASDELPKEEH